MRRYALQLAVSLLLVSGLLWTLDGGRLWALLQRVDPRWLALAVVIAALQTLANGARWALLARSLGLTGATRDFLRATCLSFTIAQVTPSSLFGEAYRLQALAGGNDKRRLLLSLVLDRLSLHAVGAMAFVVSLPFALPYAVPIESGLAAALTTAAIGALALVPGVRKKVLGVLHHLVKREARAHVLWSTAMVLSMPLLFYVCGLALGFDLALAPLFALFPCVLAALAVPVSFGGWGLRELAAAAILGPVLLDPVSVTAVSLVMGLAGLGAAALGPAWLLVPALSPSGRARCPDAPPRGTF